MRVITLQPADRTDHITEDGTELTQRPYPFHVRADDGHIERQDFWRGNPLQVVGFAERLDGRAVDVFWRTIAEDPQRAVGMYVVTADSRGGWATHLSAIAEVRVTEGGA
jgi:hypothetical protein